MNCLEELKNLLKEKNKRVCFLGGAGVSTASGIPDFRSPAGLYHVKSKYGVPYETMLSHSYFVSHPDTFYEFYWECMVKKDAKPNAAHFALAQYEKDGGSVAILTQNIDGLHSLAGSKNVIELHGSIWRYTCPRCEKRYSLNELKPNGVPHCSCGAILKPDVVLYEEPLNESVLNDAIKAISTSDILIVGGTSLNVYPAAGLIYEFQGERKIIINQENTPLDSFFDDVIHDDVGKVLSYLCL